MHAPDQAIPLGAPPRDGHRVLSPGPSDLRTSEEDLKERISAWVPSRMKFFYYLIERYVLMSI